MVRSTIQRFGSTTNLLVSDRLTIWTLMFLQTRRSPCWNFGSLIAAVSVELEQERVEAEQRRHQQHAAVAVLHIGRVHDGLHQQALGVDQDMALPALDLLARVVARRINREPPFSAPLTLWLSMIAAVGLASRPACSRQRT